MCEHVHKRSKHMICVNMYSNEVRYRPTAYIIGYVCTVYTNTWHVFKVCEHDCAQDMRAWAQDM